jgi:hypothetical protein
MGALNRQNGHFKTLDGWFVGAYTETHNDGNV